MKQSQRHKIALLFLSVYLPVALGVSFLHSHALPIPAEQQQISAQEATVVSVAKADLLCVICKFLSSHSSVFETNATVTVDLNSFTKAASSGVFSLNSILILSDRAPPFSA